MDSNYWDEERLEEAINKAARYESNTKSFDFDEYDFTCEGFLADNELESILSNLIKLNLDDFKRLKPKYRIDEVKFLAWTKFFHDYIKIYFKVQERYSLYCVHSINHLKVNFKYIKANEPMEVIYHGIKQNYKGEDYPVLTFVFKVEI